MTNKKNNAQFPDESSQTSAELALLSGQPAMPVWCASFRMALVCVAGLVAAGLIATGISGCADMSGIAPQAGMRDAPPLGLNTASNQAQAMVAAPWWRDFGDGTLSSRVKVRVNAGLDTRLELRHSEGGLPEACACS